MSITETDIKLQESERLTDTEDGGGRMTGNEVVDGQANNLFPDISQLDRVNGRVQLRKAFMAVFSPNKDTYFGSHVIVDEPPTDPNVHITLFNTEDPADRRASARSRIESFVVSGPQASMELFGDQLKGQRTISVLQLESEPVPSVGDVFDISLEPSDGATDDQGNLLTPANQFIRVNDVTTTEREFVDSNGTFGRRQVILEFTEPLREDFPGATPTRNTGASNSPTIVRNTQVADAARYFGIKPLEQAVTAGDLDIKIPSLLSKLVPATQAEQPVTDQRGAGDVSIPVVTGGTTKQVPAVAQTDRINVTLATRQFTYVNNLDPLPAPGTLQVDYRSQGQWNRITDDGNGSLVGIGAGQVDYQTGTVQITLQELPDVPSAILFTWGNRGVQFSDITGKPWTTLSIPKRVIDLEEPAQPGSITITYVSNSTNKTITDDGQGNLTGDGSGIAEYVVTGEDEQGNPTKGARLRIQFTDPVDQGSTINVDTEVAESGTSEQVETLAQPGSNVNDVSFSLSNADPIGSLEVSYIIKFDPEWSASVGFSSFEDGMATITL